jgi:uncharacterized protein (DUF1800 family)
MMITGDAAHAAIRFGLGPRPGELAEAARDPRGWLLAQLAAVPPVPEAVRAAAPAADVALAITFDQQRRQPEPNAVREAHRAAMAALTGHWTTTDAAFLERWALFWTNHLTVSQRGGNTGALVADYHLAAIRPHVLGRFETLLLAAIRHPAMLRYLDNAASVGPHSQAGQRRGRGLNENLAREILELHTLSPAAGYAQEDVTALARIITGWSSGTPGPSPFVFRANAHEPGEKALLGRVFAAGEEGGIAALAFLATHPATYRFLAGKIARHFIADDPPPEAVTALAGRLADTGGDLGAAARLLIGLEAAWARPLAKLRAPADLVVATLRALDDPLPPAARVGAFGMLGQPLFTAPAPNGWPDTAAAWTGPEALMRRVEWAGRVAARLRDPPDPRDLLEQTLGPLADQRTRAAVRGAETRREGLMVLLASPAFQRR